jgi:hypothetical protein
MGSGRTGDQNQGGYGTGGDSGYGGTGNTGGKDSTTGKLMEKAGGMFGSKGLEQKGREKRDQAGGYGGSDDTSGNY